jgi:uncharacterized protein
MLELENLPSIDLTGLKIWLSGAVPESESENPNIDDPVENWKGSQLDYGILGFVHEFSSLVFKLGGEIIHGCHPSFTPILLQQARKFQVGDTRKKLHLAVSNYFRNESSANDWERWRLDADLEVVPETSFDESQRDPSLAVLRERMASQCNAFVAIGGLWWAGVPGRAGIPKEFELAKSKGVPCFILGGFGGASQTYIESNPDCLSDLKNGLTVEQNLRIASNTNFVLVAGRLVAQLSSLNLGGSGLGAEA